MYKLLVMQSEEGSLLQVVIKINCMKLTPVVLVTITLLQEIVTLFTHTEEALMI
jgi:hypothetical protein